MLVPLARSRPRQLNRERGVMSITAPFNSGYLLQPRRTLEQVRADREKEAVRWRPQERSHDRS